MKNLKANKDYRPVYTKRMYQWVVYCAYDCAHGDRGQVLSKHETYAAAQKSLRKIDGNCGWVGIKEYHS